MFGRTEIPQIYEPAVRPSVRPQSFFSDFHLIWCVGRPRPDMHTSMTSTQCKVTELLKFRILHFSRSISSAILACSSKLMADFDDMGPVVYSLLEPHF